jgi:aryl-alcohol dehydrogenase-like predicted oxidoreductase
MDPIDTAWLGPRRQGFGAMRLRSGAASGPDRDPDAVINAALDEGLRMIDTADAYGNEELVGRAIRARRDEVVLASKFGLVWTREVARGFTVRADPPYVQEACERSLRRLGVDVIDLYYLHHRSDEVAIEETVGAMAELMEQGKVRRLGLSNVTAEDLRRAVAVAPIAALQEEWSLAQRDLERSLLPTAKELGVTIVAHSPTGHGDLHTLPDRDPQVRGRLPEVLQKVAAAHGLAPGQVALAWVHHRERIHGTPVVPLPGTGSVSHVRANAATADVVLTPAEVERLDAAAPVSRGSGTR